MDPLALFGRWLSDAVDSGLRDPNAFVLATTDPNGQPSARVLLLKEYDERGFVFYTNYGSRKAADLRENPKGALLFFWAELERQIRIEGTISKVSRAESAEYFASRPRASQLGAHASQQSSVIADRSDLENNFQKLAEQYGEHAEIPLPENWGGYVLAPHAMEFWQGRSNRLHDRLAYTRESGGSEWDRRRLSP